VTQYLLNLLISLDQTINTILGGDPDETISSRVYRNRSKWYGRIAMRVIDGAFRLLGEQQHCLNSFEPGRNSKEVI
jgi:hypothetical protein